MADNDVDAGEGDTMSAHRELRLLARCAQLSGAVPPRLGPVDSAPTRIGAMLSWMVRQ